jgi:AcrR family transcriptional regulator
VPPHPRDADERGASQRILAAAARRIATHGAAALALNDVAADAGVSKALIHYHFKDKDTLLARVVDFVVAGMIARERSALAPYATQRSPLAVDALWRWLEEELGRGSIRTLLELDAYPGAGVRNAARRAALRRREAATETIDELFSILELRSRVATPLLANVAVAFIDGLALDVDRAAPAPQDMPDAELAAVHDVRAPRVSFDVFWLAMLSLAE